MSNGKSQAPERNVSTASAVGSCGDPELPDNVDVRALVRADWKRSVEADPGYHNLIRFHSRQKYLLMAHRYQGYRELGRYLAEAHRLPLKEAMEHYIQTFMQHLARGASRKSHTNVLMHLLGYVKRSLDSAGKAELLERIERYRLGQVPLSVPLALLRHHLMHHGSDYVREQSYLDLCRHGQGIAEADSR